MWTPTDHEKFGVVVSNFCAPVSHALPLEIGECVQILEKCEGWYRGFSVRNSEVKGIFPANYVYLKKAFVNNRGKSEVAAPLEDSTVLEVTSTLKEWGVLWKQLYLTQRLELFYKLRHVMHELLDLRRQIISGHLTLDQVREVKRLVTVRLDWGNEQLGLDLVPRRDFDLVDPDQISVTDLYKLHASSRYSTQQNPVLCLLCSRRCCLQPPQSEGRSRSEQLARPPLPHHLHLSLKSFGYNIYGEDVDLYFSLYDGREGRPVSEKFVVRLNKQGMPKNNERLDRQCVLFTDLGYKDLKRDLYVVVHVVRSGRMLPNDSKKGPSNVHYRRPYGSAVLSLSEWLQSESECRDEKEFVLKVYTCNNENEWHQIQDNIIKKSSTKYNPASSNYGLIVSLQMLHGEMDQMKREHPTIFTRGVPFARKLGFSDVIMPEKKIVGCDIRNDLYITLERGEFERGGKSVQKNIEVAMFVLDAEGEILKDCVSLGAGEPYMRDFHSFVLYHNNSPRWGEILKLAIPVDKFRGSHLRFEFRHCSTKEKGEKKLFGFAFTPLMREDGTTLSDETHELYVYKCEESAGFSNPAYYLSLPCCKDDSGASGGTVGPSVSTTSLVYPRSHKESLWISTLLCSTKLTQNDLLALLKWKVHTDTVQDILGRLRQVKGEEIVKFLQDILDTLFAILDDSTEKYGPLVFQSLVFVVNLLRDTKFLHFRPVMETYIQKHFAGALAYKELLRCMKWYLDRSLDSIRHEHIQDALRAMEYLFKFVVQSRSLYARATGGLEEEEFRAAIRELFHSIKLILCQDGRDNEGLVYTQVTLLTSLPAIYEELLRMFKSREVADLVRDALGSLPTVQHAAPGLDTVRLQCVGRTVESKLFLNPESRRFLLPVVLHHIRMHLEHQKEPLVCSGILSNIFSIMKKSSGDPRVCEEVDMIVESLLEVLMKTVAGVMSKGLRHELVGEYVSCLLSLLRQMSDRHYQQLLENFSSKESLKEFVLQIFSVFSILMKQEVFPRDWMVMRMVISSVIVTTMKQLSPALHQNFGNESFDIQIWTFYFSLAVLFINQPSLQLEAFSPLKRKQILSKYGDMRVLMAHEVFRMWQSLGDHKAHFIPGLLGPFLEVTLVPQTELRRVLIPIFHEMMDCEQRKNGSFKQVEAEIIDKLDSLLSEGRGDEDYRELFSLITPLFGPYPSLLERIEQETWRESGVSFVTSVTRLMERLLDYRDCMKGDEVEDKKIGCAVSLLNFYKTEINKEEMYIRYIHKLCDMHLQAQNYTEAGFTLLLYCELLGWDERLLGPFLHYPAQSEWERKESLLLKILHFFHKGKCWEFGIPLCRELAGQYEALYDYQRLSSVRKTEAAYYDNIIEQQRLEPEFFKVGFYGKKFPFFLRNKEFVCRGHDYERLETFQQRMLSEFPHAVPMQHAGQPDDATTHADAQYIQIFAVSPVPGVSEVLRNERIPERIKSFYRVNNICKFRYDRPLYKGTKDKENEFKNLWVERTTLILKQPLPGICRWFEVDKREVAEMSPLENAIEAVENKNTELRLLIGQYRTQPPHNLNPLSMCLNGVINAAVNGGIARYQEAFFDKEYLATHPEDVEKIGRLKDVMLEQVYILGAGLSVHERFVHPEMRPLHRKLLEQFQMMRSSLASQDLMSMGRISPAFAASLGQPNVFSPNSMKIFNRQSSLSLPGSNRVSSSSLSSQASAETGNMAALSDSLQPSSSSSSLSSAHSVSAHIISSAPCSARGSPMLSDKYRHCRDPTGLSALMRDRPCSAVFPVISEHGQQPPAMHRALIQQVTGSGKLSSDPNLSMAERAVPAAPSSWSLDSGTRDMSIYMKSKGSVLGPPPVPPRVGHPGMLPIGFEAFHQQITDIPPALPMRNLHKMSLRSLAGSPTGQTTAARDLNCSHSTLSASASSGVSSLSDCVSLAGGAVAPGATPQGGEVPPLKDEASPPEPDSGAQPPGPQHQRHNSGGSSSSHHSHHHHHHHNSNHHHQQQQHQQQQHHHHHTHPHHRQHPPQPPRSRSEPSTVGQRPTTPRARTPQPCRDGAGGGGSSNRSDSNDSNDSSPSSSGGGSRPNTLPKAKTLSPQTSMYSESHL
ncbi:dedicator of cytokinesis protein 3 isoform X3 [Lampetra fluviatilis]